MTKSILFLLSCFWLPFGVVSAGALEQGIEFFEKKNYAAAKKLWQPLAKDGDVRAQYNLALLLLKDKKSQQLAEAKKYLAMTQSAGLIDGYFFTIPDSPRQDKSVKANQTLVKDPLIWLSQQNKRSYTLQLATGKVRRHIEEMRNDLLKKQILEQSNNLYIQKVQSIEKQGVKQKTSVRYILVYGVFDSYQLAKAEVSKLPLSMQKSSPWIRQFSVLQSIVDK